MPEITNTGPKPEHPPFGPGGVSSEVRTTSATGGLKGVKPERYSFIPKAPLDLLARIYGYGDEKYGDAHNYRKGYEWSKNYDALQRHLTAWWDREDNDPESGLSHLGHAAWHIFSLIVFSSDPKYKQYDDRYRNDASGIDLIGLDPGNSDFIRLEIDGRPAIMPRDVFESGMPVRNWIEEQTRALLKKETQVNEHAICFYEDALRSVSHVCLEHGQTSKYGISEGPHRACQAVDPWVPPTSKDLSDAIRGAMVSSESVTLLPEYERPFTHPNGDKVACDYKYVFGEGGSHLDGYYLCKVHESRTDRHPSEGANRPCIYIDPTGHTNTNTEKR